MPESLLERAKANRETVLLAELGAWLHDLGKLSRGFVESKTDAAYGDVDEEAMSPPIAGAERKPNPCPEKTACSEPPEVKWVHGCVLKYDSEAAGNPLSDQLNAWMIQPHPTPLGDLTLSLLISEHHRSSKSHLLKLLKQADGNDSAEDQYNAADLSQPAPVQSTTVFGCEEPLALVELDDKRQALYPELEALLCQPDTDFPSFDRTHLWKKHLGAVFRLSLGKTQRAANDIRLDQHVWGVASRFKAFVARDLINELLPEEERKPGKSNAFRLLTVQWDSWGAITPFARLSDVAGRAALLADVRDALRDAIETEYAIGNRIYEDDDGIHFLVADLKWEAEIEQGKTEKDVLFTRVREIVNAKSGGELLPVVTLSDPTEHVTLLARQMAEARKTLPVVGAPEWVATWQGDIKPELCPVCHQRPSPGDASLCDWCAKRRRAGAQQRREQSGTFQTGEIADARGKTALIVARFDLEDWLKGDLLHTLFITSPQDVAQSEDIVDALDWNWQRLGTLVAPTEAVQAELAAYEAAIKQAKSALQSKCAKLHNLRENNSRTVEQEAQIAIFEEEAQSLYTKLQEAQQQPLSTEARIARYLQKYGRLSKALKIAAGIAKDYYLPDNDALLLAVTRKNLSAARLLRVWQTTEEFLQDQAKALKTAVGPERQRAVLTLWGTAPKKGYYTADLPTLGTIEILVRGDGKIQTTTPVTTEQIESLRAAAATGAPLRFQAGENNAALGGDYTIVQVDKEPYIPFQVITASPNLLLAMVPADKALAIAQEMQTAYAAEFSKVQGRLPFHVGLVFMDAHYPMFAALDTARRFAETFDDLGNLWTEAKVTAIETHPASAGDGEDYTLHMESDRFGTWQWRVSARLGNDAPDYYHPYMLVRNGDNLKERGMSLLGPYGRWVHVSQVQAGDTIGFLPNLFDFISLDTVSRRLEAHLSADPEARNRRPHPLLGARHSPRPYLLERVGDLAHVWETICDVPGMSESRLQAATTLLARKWEAWELAKNSDGARAEPYRWLVGKTVAQDFNGSEVIHHAILNGSYFDVIDLYRHILKQPIQISKTQTKEEEVA